MDTSIQDTIGETELERSPHREALQKTGMGALMLGALGVVYGDIGTSPLYSLQAAFTFNNHAVHVNETEVYGVISLVFWSITILVSLMYLTFIMRADDRGEGGIMALTALLTTAKRKGAAVPLVLVTMGVLGACLFFGDGAITPAVSVLGAVAGLQVAVPSLGSLVVPISVAVLTVLFAIQRYGTGFVGKLFGPVMLVWFIILALLGAVEVARHPAVLRALSPTYAVQFFAQHGVVAFLALGSVVLAVTGAEALYADMGHFGRSPIRRSWFLLIFPSLTLNYLGQGSLILRAPGAVSNPFYFLVPGWAQIPMVFVATAATVIASQAVIAGAFSVSQQAVQLGFLPRLTIRHTSAREIGQIYVPAVNAVLFVAVLAIVIGFGSANALTNAYGVAVTGTFLLTTTLFLSLAARVWRKPTWQVALGAVVFLILEVGFFTSNLTKVVHGGWFPLGTALVVFTVLTTWHKGRQIVTTNRSRTEGLLADFVEQLGSADSPIGRVPGVGVFLTPNLKATPLALRANVEHNHVLHDRVIIVSVRFERAPHVADVSRVVPETPILFSGATGDPLGTAETISLFTVRFGFLDEPDVPSALRLAAQRQVIGGDCDIDHATYFLSNITIVPTDTPGIAGWRKKLYVAMARNAADPAEYFRLPDTRTVTTSGRIQL